MVWSQNKGIREVQNDTNLQQAFITSAKDVKLNRMDIDQVGGILQTNPIGHTSSPQKSPTNSLQMHQVPDDLKLKLAFCLSEMTVLSKGLDLHQVWEDIKLLWTPNHSVCHYRKTMWTVPYPRGAVRNAAATSKDGIEQGTAIQWMNS